MATKKKVAKKPQGLIRKETREMARKVQDLRDMADKSEEYFQRMGAEKVEGGFAEVDKDGKIVRDEDGKVNYNPGKDEKGNDIPCIYYGVFLENGFSRPGSHKYVVEGDKVTLYRKQKKTDKKGKRVLDKSTRENILEDVKLRTTSLHDIRT